MDKQDAKKGTRCFGLSRNVITMGVVSFFNDLSSDMVFPFIPIFLTSVLGAGAISVGLIEGVADATASIMKIFSGRLSDIVRRRKPFIVAGYSLSAITKPFLALAASPWHVLVVRFVDRAGKGVREAPRDALLSASTVRSQIGRAFGFHRAADTMGAAAGPLVAFLILPFINNDLRTLFLLSFIASFIAVVILQLFVREVRREKTTAPLLDAGGTLVHFGWRGLGIPFFIFLAAATIFALGRASEAFLLLRAQDLGVALALLPIIYFVYNITYALFSTPAGMLSDKIGHRNTFMIGMLIFSGTYFLFARVSSVTALWFLFAVYGFYSAFTEGVGRAIVADLVEERLRATAYGIYHAFTGAALLPAGIIFGVLWDRLGAPASFSYGAFLGLAALVVFLLLRVVNHRRQWQTR